MAADEPPHPRDVPHLHVRPCQRFGGDDRSSAKIVGNRAGLLRLREQIDHALGLEGGMGSVDWSGYREIDGRAFGLVVLRATGPEKMGEPREPDPPDYS